MTDKIEKLKEFIALQSTHGNYNYDPYMFGMANGMIFALALLDDKEPEYLDKPKIFLCDSTNKEILDSIVKESNWITKAKHRQNSKK